MTDPTTTPATGARPSQEVAGTARDRYYVAAALFGWGIHDRTTGTAPAHHRIDHVRAEHTPTGWVDAMNEANARCAALNRACAVRSTTRQGAAYWSLGTDAAYYYLTAPHPGHEDHADEWGAAAIPSGEGGAPMVFDPMFAGVMTAVDWPEHVKAAFRLATLGWALDRPVSS